MKMGVNDGNIRILGGVRYVLRLDYNYILLGIFDVKWY